ncbi:integral membrane protein 2A-like [Scyliorhinus canicula]|uniref:integral membrane protein 2A-like n=1 Tax=Scyliorhinus canicula TaxID=7830 RepID=UPI0018F5FF9C|nr:integral membrane protein 2A-like [Scyliorhinus canicula]
MVKIGFNSPAAPKDGKGALLVAEPDPETAVVDGGENSTGRCLFTLLGLAFILSGLIIGGACLYRFIVPKNKVFHGRMQYSDSNVLPDALETEAPYFLAREDVQFLGNDGNVALIDVPVPEFDDADPAVIIHDFELILTAYLDLKLDNCYVIALNTSVVLPPRNLLELFMRLATGDYLPQTYLVHEDLMVTERIDNVDQLGYFIYRLCSGKKTYRLQHRNTLKGIQKRSTENCHRIKHFANNFVLDTLICEPYGI